MVKVWDANEYFHIGRPGQVRLLGQETIDTRVKRVMTQELSKTSLPGWMNQIYQSSYINPSQLSINEYDEMLRDPQIKTAAQLLIYALLSREFYITPASDDDFDVEVAQFIEKQLKNVGMRRVRREMYMAILYGYTVSEVVYTYVDTPDGGRIGIKKIKGLPLNTLRNCFKVDEYGDIQEVVQTPVGGGEIRIPVEKCLINTFDGVFGNHYGQSILEQVYNNYYMKKEILRWYLIFLQKHEGPTLAGRVGEGGDPDMLQANLDAIQEGSTNLIHGPNDEVYTIETQHRGEGFTNAIGYHDTVILRRFIIGSLLLGQQDGKGGSYAQSQTQFDVFNLFLDGIHEDMSIVFQGLVERLVDFNYNVEKYPKFNFESFTKQDLLSLLESLQPYVASFAVSTDSNWFKQLLKRVMEQYADITIEDDEVSFDGRPNEGELPAEHLELVEQFNEVLPAENRQVEE